MIRLFRDEQKYHARLPAGTQFVFSSDALKVFAALGRLKMGGPFRGPRGPFKGPRVPLQGPRGAFKGPRGPFKGLRGPFKGPRGPFKGSRGPFSGPRGPFKGPRGPFKGPGGPFKGPRGTSTTGCPKPPIPARAPKRTTSREPAHQKQMQDLFGPVSAKSDPGVLLEDPGVLL